MVTRGNGEETRPEEKLKRRDYEGSREAKIEQSETGAKRNEKKTQDYTSISRKGCVYTKPKRSYGLP